jgi:ADP-ribose pyrophosphatase YjhB (NUDIX family)
MGLDENIDEIESQIGDPRQGLPDAVFSLVTRLTPMVNVDLLIRNNRGQTLLVWRDDGFYRGWHVPGGIVRFKERMADRVAAVARIELGTRVTLRGGPVAMNEVVYPERRVRGHFISFLYECDLVEPPDETLRHVGGLPSHGQWAWHSACPPEIIPSHEMYRRFLDHQPCDT